MAKIRIIAAPPGEAPLHIREAWVGVLIPLPPGSAGKCREGYSFGVLTGPKGVWGQLFAITTRRAARWKGYTVETILAVDALGKLNMEAAQWWRTHAAHLMKPGKMLIFPAEVCQEEP